MRIITPREQQKDLFSRRWRQVAGATAKEHQVQIQLVSMLKWCLKPTVTFFHVPNGELRDKRSAAKLKAMGVLPGVSDLVFLWKQYWEDLEGSHTAPAILFLELKLPGKAATDEQVAFGLAVRLCGAEFAVARSIEAAIKELGRRGLIRPDVTVCGIRWDGPTGSTGPMG